MDDRERGVKSGECGRWGPQVARWLEEFPGLEPLVERVVRAGEALRETVAAAFVTPAEPVRPEDPAWERAAEAARRALGCLEAEPSGEHADALLAALVELRARAYWIAPTRRTSGPVARWAVMEAIRLFREAWEPLEAAAREGGALPVPWRLAFASHVPPEAPWAEAEILGNAVPGVPVAGLPWGERCALTGRWYQRDALEGPVRWRSLDAAGFAVDGEWGEFLARTRAALDRLRGADPDAVRRFEAGFPEIAHHLTREPYGETFARLGVADFPSLAVALNNALVRFAGRPAFGVVKEGAEGAEIAWWTYGELRERILAVAYALERAGIEPGTRVGVAFCGGREQAYVVDMACVLAGAVSVGLDPAWPAVLWREALDAAGATVAVGDREALGRLGHWAGRGLCLEEGPSGGAEPLLPEPSPPGWRSASGVGPGTPALHDDAAGWAVASSSGLEPDGPGALYSIVFTSGSSGRPKGVPVSRERIRRVTRMESEIRPLVAVSYRPYALLADRLTVWQALCGGGRVGFCRGGPALWEDVGRFAPTFLEGPPAFWRPVAAAYAAALERGEAANVLAAIALEQRARLGGRIAVAGVGGAAVEPGLTETLAAVLGCEVHEGYGTSETGPIAQDGLVEPGCEVRLLDRPDLGMTARDEPHPRGELLVRGPWMAGGYVGGSPEDSGRFTEDGFFCTGDLVELLPDGRIRVLGREGELVKLASGRFAVPSEVERVLESCPAVREAVALPVPGGSGLAAVVVPRDPGADPEAVRQEVWERLRSSGLPRDWVPVAVVVDTDAGEGWTPESGLRTGSLKPRREALAARYAGRIAAGLGSAVSEVGGDAVAWLVRVAAGALGRPPAEVAPDRTLAELGAGSLAVAEVAAALAARGALELPPERVAATPIRELAAALGNGAAAGPERTGDAAERGEGAAPAPDLPGSGLTPSEDEVTADLVRLPLPEALPEPAADGFVLVTGATGFLGLHLLEALAGPGGRGARVVALVRAESDGAARRRLEAAAREAGVELGEAGTPDEPEGRIVAVAGDLAAHRLGLDEDLYDRLAREVACIVHAGAVVDPAMPYRDLREVNVAGTARLLELATTRRLKRFVLVSSLDVTLLAERSGADGGEEAPLPERLPGSVLGAASGYAVSKWAAERMVQMEWLHCRGRLPCTVVRPGILSWSAATGLPNAGDWLTRILLACLELGRIPAAVPASAHGEPVATETSARGLEPLPVDAAARIVAALAAAGGPPPGPELGQPPRLHLVNPNPGERGFVTWPHLFWLLAAAALAECPERGPLRPVPWRDWRLAAIARETRAAALAMSGGALPEYRRVRSVAARRALGELYAAPPVDLELARRLVGWAVRTQAI